MFAREIRFRLCDLLRKETRAVFQLYYVMKSSFDIVQIVYLYCLIFI